MPYYYMIDKHDYEAFVWIKDNVNESYEKAILDRGKPLLYCHHREKVYTRIHAYPTPVITKPMHFLEVAAATLPF